jgi:hypothetical protein
MPPAVRRNIYDYTEEMRVAVANGQHRALIGGMWEELGTLQAEFLKAQGLRPGHTVIDIGAGSFRAGVKLVPYLDPGNYYAIDLLSSLLEAGYSQEIEPAGLAARFPRRNFAATESFDLSMFRRRFDFGIAQSVFSHTPISVLGNCLAAVAPHFRAGGLFFATVFLAPEAAAGAPFVQMPGGIVTRPDQDPFHTTASALRGIAARAIKWHMAPVGDWGHPRNQQMLRFTRR